jgi:membrane fusion protein (multidrug efflux system)
MRDIGAARFLVAIGLLATALAAGAAGCQRRPPGGGPGGMAVHVVGFRASARPVEERVAVVGTLAASEFVEIKSEVEGRIEEIGAEEGRGVEAGAVLLRIDRSKLEASLAEAEANLKLAESTLERYAALSASRAVSQQEVDQARSNFQARAAAVALMRAQLEDATITAPFAGVVGERLVSAGQYVTKGQPLTSLVDTDPMNVECQVPERFLGQLAAEQPIAVRVAAYPEEEFRGAVYFVAPQVDPATRTVLVKARVPNAEGRLRPGMFADLDLILRVRERAVLVPDTALMLQAESASVYVVAADGTAQARQVQTGVRQAQWVEVVSGLKPGEVVVTEGLQKVHPGAAVSVRFEETAAPASPAPPR